MAQTSGFDPTSQVKTCFDCKMFDVANLVSRLNGENGPGGTPSHEALSVSPQGALEILLDNLLPWTETISAHLDWWQNPTNVMKDADLHPKDHSIQLLQLNSSSLHKQARRNPLGRDVCSPVENYDLVQSLQDNIKSQTHFRVSECDGRPT